MNNDAFAKKSIIKSLFYNIKLFGFRVGIKCPILFSSQMTVQGLSKGRIKLPESPERFGISIGFGGSNGVSSNKGYLSIGTTGLIVFKGRASFGAGASIRVDSGTLTIGKNFSANKNVFISCTDSVKIGDNVLFGWNCNVRDSEGHRVIIDGKANPDLKPVLIGDYVWVAANVDILKGVTIGDNSVIAYRSCVLKPMEGTNLLIAGYPAKIVRNNIEWKA